MTANVQSNSKTRSSTKPEVQTLAKEADVDACLFLSTEERPSLSMKYLAGAAGDSAALLTFKRKQALYLHSPLESAPKLDGLKVEKRESGSISQALTQAKATTIGLNYEEITKSDYDNLRGLLRKRLGKVTFKDVSPYLNKRRQIKTERESRTLKEAVKRTEKLLAELIERLPDMTYEHEGIIYLKKRVLDMGDELAFEPIVASGKDSRNPHYEPSPAAKLKKGFCIIDFGVKHKGYCADITRTVYLGTPSKTDVEFYNNVRNEQKRLERELKSGTSRMQPSFSMVHALGHGIGLDVHEPPLVGRGKLQTGVTIALEPARYEQQGVRIEDDYIVTEHGLKRLSKSSRELKRVRK